MNLVHQYLIPGILMKKIVEIVFSKYFHKNMIFE